MMFRAGCSSASSRLPSILAAALTLCLPSFDAIADRQNQLDFANSIRHSLADIRSNRSNDKGTRKLGTLMFYDPARDLAGGAEGAAYENGDRAWVERGLRVYDLYRQLGGELPTALLYFRHADQGYYVSIGGTVGAWFEVEEAALSYLLRGLVTRSDALSSPLKSRVMGGRNQWLTDLSQALTSYLESEEAPLRLSGSQTLEVAFDNADIVVAEQGLAVVNSEPREKGVTASLRVEAGSDPGERKAYGFTENRRFRPVEERALLVTSAPAVSNLNPTTDISSEGPIELVSNASGQISSSGAIVEFDVPVSETGTLTISSSGPSDLVAELVDPSGQVIAEDDDAGSGYNFSLSSELTPGTYRLRVRHCCSGTGPFTVSVTK